MKRVWRILLILVTIILCICYVSLLFVDGSMHGTDYDYILVNDRFSLDLDASNSCITSKVRYGIRDVSYIIEYSVNPEKMNSLAQTVQSNECWISYSGGSTELVETYIRPYARVFDELTTLIRACGHQLSYVQVYPLEADSEDRFSVAVVDVISNTVYMFYNE